MAGKRRIQRRRSTGRTVAIVLVCVVVLAGMGLAGYLLLTRNDPATAGPDESTVVTTTSKPPAVADPKPAVPRLALAPLRNSKSAPTEAGIAKALAPVLADRALASYAGEVIDPTTGTVLWKKDPGSSQIPASTAKLLTGAALLTSVKDPDARLSTTVVKGDQEGDIIFVGGGDVTLSARGAGVGTVYDGAPTVADLAAQVKASGVSVKRIVLDTSYWSGPDFASGWKSEDIGAAGVRGGYITRMSPLMVDGDRVDPANPNSARSGDAAKTAGKALARALGNADLPLIDGTAPPNGQLIAKVQSQPLSILLAQALLNSDNVLAESLAREVAGARGAPRSFDGAAAAILLALDDLKIDTINVQLFDGSGMSENDRVTPDILAQILSQAVAGKKPALRYLLTGLPVAGVSGTLAADEREMRFDDARSRAGAGWVRAKTGSLNSTLVLTGYVPDADGRTLVFSLISNASISGNAIGATRAAHDWFAAVLRQCGCTG